MRARRKQTTKRGSGAEHTGKSRSSVWEIETSQQAAEFDAGELSADGKVAVVNGKLWDVDRNEVVRPLESGPETRSGPAFTHVTGVVPFGDSARSIEVLDQSKQFSPDGTRFAAAG